MNGYLGTIGSSFSSMWHSREGINLKSIRLSRLCYMLAYTFELILFSVKWITQLSANDMELIREKVDEQDRFGEYALTPRQKEIETMLLAAKTRRQIAGELGVSESTVKNHTSELYKKLGINSRVELFKIFGVDENVDG